MTGRAAPTPTAPPLSTPDDLRDLMRLDISAEQIAAITAPLAPGVVVAGAGSGKTTVMAARVVWLVGTGAVTADQVLGLTFTKKAAGELAERIRSYLTTAGLLPRSGNARVDHPDAAEPAEPTVSTYHSYAARLLSEYGLRIGHEPDSRLIADASRFQLAARAISQHRDPVLHLPTWMPSSVTGLLNLDAQLREHLVSTADLLAWQDVEEPLWRSAQQRSEVGKVVDTLAKRRELVGFVASYRRLKTELGVMDFSDQMSLGAELAQACPDVGAVERDRFRVVLLDEYQDTSIAQARLLRALYSDSVDAAGRGHPVTAVGDPCQAIYGWRGASVANIDKFSQEFPEADGTPATRFTLSVNLRSQARILSTANTLAAPLHAVHPGAAALTPRAVCGPGVVRAAVLDTFDEELGFLAREVPRAHAALPRPRWSSIAVLVRDNRTASEVRDALTAVGVPVEVVGLSGLLAMPEVAEVVATLQVLHDVTANASLLTLLAGPRWAIGVRDLALLGKRANRLAAVEPGPAHELATELQRAVSGVDPADVVSLLEALEDPGPAGYSAEARERFASLAGEFRNLRRYVGGRCSTWCAG